MLFEEKESLDEQKTRLNNEISQLKGEIMNVWEPKCNGFETEIWDLQSKVDLCQSSHVKEITGIDTTLHTLQLNRPRAFLQAHTNCHQMATRSLCACISDFVYFQIFDPQSDYARRRTLQKSTGLKPR